jgi:hypothetical protein
MEGQVEKRTVKDRRRRPTPLWDWYTFFGRRRQFRRRSDREKAGHTDRVSPVLFLLLILILTLNVADSVLTMMITDLGGKEYNPVVLSVMALYGHHFWIWKFALVSLSLILLMLHRGYRLFRRIIVAISFCYLLVVIYEIFLVTQLRRFFG